MFWVTFTNELYDPETSELTPSNIPRTKPNTLGVLILVRSPHFSDFFLFDLKNEYSVHLDKV